MSGKLSFGVLILVGVTLRCISATNDINSGSWFAPISSEYVGYGFSGNLDKYMYATTNSGFDTAIDLESGQISQVSETILATTESVAVPGIGWIFVDSATTNFVAKVLNQSQIQYSIFCSQPEMTTLGKAGTMSSANAGSVVIYNYDFAIFMTPKESLFTVNGANLPKATFANEYNITKVATYDSKSYLFLLNSFKVPSAFAVVNENLPEDVTFYGIPMPTTDIFVLDSQIYILGYSDNYVRLIRPVPNSLRFDYSYFQMLDGVKGSSLKMVACSKDIYIYNSMYIWDPNGHAKRIILRGKSSIKNVDLLCREGALVLALELEQENSSSALLAVLEPTSNFNVGTISSELQILDVTPYPAVYLGSGVMEELDNVMVAGTTSCGGRSNIRTMEYTPEGSLSVDAKSDQYDVLPLGFLTD
mmetsp:Transcript_49461/g.56771  ORF Transcript_49461/g.56771 Transcript_49461/m.56771 type:complete len:418 (+) Transcript_49461:68-1321(+)